nr:hypothetical protein [uncultured Carboxylicivirga sp.]
MRFKIDKEKSLQKSKLILKQGFLDRYFDWISFLGLITIFPALAIFSTMTSSVNKENILGHLIGIILSLTFSIVAIIGRNDSRKLVRLKGENLIDNKRRIEELIDSEKWTLFEREDNIDYIIPRDVRNQISVIYKGDFIFVNVVTFGRGDIISPLRIFKTNGLKDELIKKLNNVRFTTLNISNSGF